MSKGTSILRKLRNLGLKLLPTLILLAAVGGVVGLQKVLPDREEVFDPQAEAVINVQVERIDPIERWQDTLSLPARTEPDEITRIRAEVPARVETYAPRGADPVDPKSPRDPEGAGGVAEPVDEGDHVEKHQPILYLNAELLAADFAVAKAEYDRTLEEFERVEQLKREGVATEHEFDLADAALKTSAARLSAAEARLRRTRILAEASGVLNRLPVEAGEYVNSGTVVAEIVDMDPAKVVVQVPEREVQYVSVGQEAQITSTVIPELEANGKVTYISATSEPLALTTRVEISVPNADGPLRAGQIVQVALTRRVLEDVITIPLDAVVPLEEGYMVFVVRDGRAVPIRGIELDLRSIRAKRVRVLPGSGLGAGDKLIVRGQTRVSETLTDPGELGPGQKVRIIPRGVETRPASATAPAPRPAGASAAAPPEEAAE